MVVVMMLAVMRPHPGAAAPRRRSAVTAQELAVVAVLVPASGVQRVRHAGQLLHGEELLLLLVGASGRQPQVLVVRALHLEVQLHGKPRRLGHAAARAGGKDVVGVTRRDRSARESDHQRLVHSLVQIHVQPCRRAAQQTKGGITAPLPQKSKETKAPVHTGNATIATRQRREDNGKNERDEARRAEVRKGGERATTTAGE